MALAAGSVETWNSHRLREFNAGVLNPIEREIDVAIMWSDNEQRVRQLDGSVRCGDTWEMGIK